MSLYLKTSDSNYMVYPTFPFSRALSLNHSSSQSLFSSQLIFLWWFSLKRYLCYTLYIVKAKEILKSLCGNESWLMENGVVNGGKNRKSQGIEGSANENDVWVWMWPHINKISPNTL
jgi:hypothetical protein